MNGGRWRRIAVLALLFSSAGCGGGEEGPELWIYTSIYPSVIQRIEPALSAAFPEVRFRWYQMGSEQVAARLGAELAAGTTPCDLLLTSDPFYYLELKEAGHLLAYDSPAASAVPAALRDPDGAFATVRICLVVLGVNTREVPADGRPGAFADLAAERFSGRVSMGDPLKSGTAFAAVATLVRQGGWDLLERMAAGDLVAAGGNSAVIQRLETGERPVGIVLLENLLPRIEEGAPLAVVFPTDGAIPVPSPVAILAGTEHPVLARRVYDFLFQDAVQDAIVAGSMYSPVPGRPPPAGAPSWDAVARAPWDAEFLDWGRENRPRIKERFRQVLRR